MGAIAFVLIHVFCTLLAIDKDECTMMYYQLYSQFIESIAVMLNRRELHMMQSCSSPSMIALYRGVSAEGIYSCQSRVLYSANLRRLTSC